MLPTESGLIWPHLALKLKVPEVIIRIKFILIMSCVFLKEITNFYAVIRAEFSFKGKIVQCLKFFNKEIQNTESVIFGVKNFFRKWTKETGR
jgi:hypothetical protein